MKFEKLTDDKIRIILSIEDIKSTNLSIKSLLSSSSSSQELLQTLLDMAKEEIGFMPQDSKLLVKAVMPSDKECIFTITKLPNAKIKLKKSSSFIFKFNTFDDFMDLCNFIKNFSNLNFKDFSQNFSLIFYNNTYYLVALDIENFSILLDYIKPIFCEFGEDLSKLYTLNGILNEYGKIIFDKNAFCKCLDIL